MQSRPLESQRCRKAVLRFIEAISNNQSLVSVWIHTDYPRARVTRAYWTVEERQRIVALLDVNNTIQLLSIQVHSFSHLCILLLGLQIELQEAPAELEEILNRNKRFAEEVRFKKMKIPFLP